MSEYTVAPSYRDWETIGTPLVENGKMYTKIKRKCDRCVNGVYVCRIENGMPVPHPNANGVCFQCGGTGYEVKKVRLYSVAEAEKMEKRNEEARIKRAIAAEAKIKAEYAQKRAKWIEDHGFSSNGVTYVITGDSYSIKDELKAAGFIFDYTLKWHKAEVPAEYADRVKEIKMDDIIDFSAWGEGHYKNGAADYIEKILVENSEDASSAWVGTKGDKIDVTVTFVSKRGYQGRYGYSNVYTFKTMEGNLLTWFSTVEVKKEIGEKFELIATVKDHNEYKGIKSTIITRGKVK